MVEWTAEIDRKARLPSPHTVVYSSSDILMQLFYAVILQKNLTFGNADHAELSKMMGDGESPISNAAKSRITYSKIAHPAPLYDYLLEA